MSEQDKPKRPGEFELIRRMTALLPTKGDGLLLPIGDDASLHGVTPGMVQATTCDILAEDVHFRRCYDPRDVGYKSLTVNLSDLAAMGARPRLAWIGLAIPKDLGFSWVEGFTEGLAAAARRFGVIIAGGDTTGSSGGIFINITVSGEVEADRALRRGGAKSGDRVLLSRPTGLSYAGFLALERQDSLLAPSVRETLVAAHLLPEPELELGIFLSRCGLATACLDVSDGLAQDLGHICEQSGLGVRIHAERLPLSRELQACAEPLGLSPLSAMLQGGEDYSLLFTVNPNDIPALRACWPASLPQAVDIGEMLPDPTARELHGQDGSVLPLQGGWDHFR